MSKYKLVKQDSLQHINVPAGLIAKYKKDSRIELPKLNIAKTTPNKTPDLSAFIKEPEIESSESSEKPKQKQKARPRAISCHNRQYSDSDEACTHMFNLSLDEIMKQHRRIKEQISYLVNQMDRTQCMDFCKKLIKKYPELQRISIEHLSRTSPRFQNLLSTPRRQIRPRTGSSNGLYRIPLSPRIPEDQLTHDQKTRDLVRLRAHLNMLTANLQHSETLGMINMILDEYPRLKQINSQYFVMVSPRGFDVMNNH